MLANFVVYGFHFMHGSAFELNKGNHYWGHDWALSAYVFTGSGLQQSPQVDLKTIGKLEGLGFLHSQW